MYVSSMPVTCGYLAIVVTLEQRPRRHEVGSVGWMVAAKTLRRIEFRMA